MEPVESTVVEPNLPGPTSWERRAIQTFFGEIRTRIVSGLILALPIAITFWIVVQLYLTLQALVIDPTTAVIRWIVGVNRPQDLPEWYRRFVSPMVAIGCVLALLYFLGLFVSTRLARFIDWLMSRVPVVTTIYHAVRGVFQSLGNQKGPGRFKRVVSVAYGGPGAPRAGVRDADDARRRRQAGRSSRCSSRSPRCRRRGSSCSCAEEDVVDLGWTVNETMQGIVSGGLSMPATVRFAPAQGLDGLLGDDLGLIDERPPPSETTVIVEPARPLPGPGEVGPVRHPGPRLHEADAVEADRDPAREAGHCEAVRRRVHLQLGMFGDPASERLAIEPGPEGGRRRTIGLVETAGPDVVDPARGEARRLGRRTPPKSGPLGRSGRRARRGR